MKKLVERWRYGEGVVKKVLWRGAYVWNWGVFEERLRNRWDKVSVNWLNCDDMGWVWDVMVVRMKREEEGE